MEGDGVGRRRQKSVREFSHMGVVIHMGTPISHLTSPTDAMTDCCMQMLGD